MSVTTTAERCRKKNEFYQRKFRDVAPMTSNELAALRRKDTPAVDPTSGPYQSYYATDDGSPIILVDVRSKAERSVSIIPGAISLDAFENNVASTLPPDAIVVCYCTIGYRSGLEARRLKEKHSLEGRIRNLEGIVSYTHADPVVVGVNDSASSSREKPHLVDPFTGEKSDIVHIFGKTWDCVDEAYETTHFSLPVLAVRSVGVGILSSVRLGQHMIYLTKQCCCSRTRSSTVVEDVMESSTRRPVQVECPNAQLM